MKLETLSKKRKVLGRLLWAALLVLTAAVYSVPDARAQDSLGGHVGFVLPLVTRSAGQTTNLAEGSRLECATPQGIKIPSPTSRGLLILCRFRGISDELISFVVHWAGSGSSKVSLDLPSPCGRGLPQSV